MSEMTPGQGRFVEFQRAENAEAECERLREQLADFARTGLRVDLNPTRYFGADSSVVDEYQWWCGYISRADAGVRSRARAALDGFAIQKTPEESVGVEGEQE